MSISFLCATVFLCDVDGADADCGLPRSPGSVQKVLMLWAADVLRLSHKFVSLGPGVPPSAGRCDPTIFSKRLRRARLRNRRFSRPPSDVEGTTCLLLCVVVGVFMAWSWRLTDTRHSTMFSGNPGQALGHPVMFSGNPGQALGHAVTQRTGSPPRLGGAAGDSNLTRTYL